MLSAIIMASGFSSRMGSNKLLLPYKGKTIIEAVLDRVIDCGFYDIILVAKDSRVLEIGSSRGIKAIYNERAELGQSESIKLGLANSKDSEGYAFFTGDQPLMDVESIKLLIDCFNKAKNSIIVPVCKEKRGTPVIFPERFKNELFNLSGDTGGKQIIAKHLDAVKFTEVKSEFLLFDIDTQEDYRYLLSQG